MSKNKFEIHGDRISISHPDWDFIASASIRDDYAEELQSVIWSKKGDYLYSNKLEIYLHIYIMRKWYGDDTYETMKDEGYIRNMRINSGLNELLVFLMNESWHPAEHPDRARKKQNLLPVRNYLEMHDTEKIVLDELADRFFISKFHLSRVFKEQFGVCIHTYVRNLRITKAKQMLRFTDKKLEDIGYRCGLGAPHYFSRIFKQVEGITPSEFREKWGEAGH